MNRRKLCQQINKAIPQIYSLSRSLSNKEELAFSLCRDSLTAFLIKAKHLFRDLEKVSMDQEGVDETFLFLRELWVGELFSLAKLRHNDLLDLNHIPKTVQAFYSLSLEMRFSLYMHLVWELSDEELAEFFDQEIYAMRSLLAGAKDFLLAGKAPELLLVGIPIVQISEKQINVLMSDVAAQLIPHSFLKTVRRFIPSRLV